MRAQVRSRCGDASGAPVPRRRFRKPSWTLRENGTCVLPALPPYEPELVGGAAFGAQRQPQPSLLCAQRYMRLFLSCVRHSARCGVRLSPPCAPRNMQSRTLPFLPLFSLCFLPSRVWRIQYPATAGYPSHLEVACAASINSPIAVPLTSTIMQSSSSRFTIRSWNWATICFGVRLLVINVGA